MKRILFASLFLGAFALICPSRRANAQVGVSVTIGGFYDEMAPYGRWVDCSFGQCWVPGRVAADWQPYTNGQWVYTEYGWTWVSDDPWGGNPYHYGTWASLPSYGWCWIPGTVWAPAWVTWSYGHDYVGWAPMPPTVTFGASGYSGRAVVVSSAHYVFVPMNHFVGGNVNAYRASSRDNDRLFRETKHVTRFSASGGYLRNTAIPVKTIQKATGSRIQTHAVSEARVTPRQVTAGGTGKKQHYAIIAPPHEVKAAIAQRPQTASRAAAPASRQGSTSAHESAKSAPPAQGGQKVHEAVPAEPRHEATHAHTQSRPEAAKAPSHAEPQPSESHHAAPPAQSHVQKEAPKPPPHAEQHSGQPRQEAAPARHAKPPVPHAEPPAQHAQSPAEQSKPPAQHALPPAEHAKPSDQHVQPAAKKNSPDHEKPAPQDRNDEKH